MRERKREILWIPVSGEEAIRDGRNEERKKRKKRERERSGKSKAARFRARAEEDSEGGRKLSRVHDALLPFIVSGHSFMNSEIALNHNTMSRHVNDARGIQ